MGAALTLVEELFGWQQPLRLATLFRSGPWCSPVEEPQDDAQHGTDHQRCRERDIKPEVLALDDDIAWQAAKACPGDQRPEQSGRQQRQAENDKELGTNISF